MRTWSSQSWWGETTNRGRRSNQFMKPPLVRWVVLAKDTLGFWYIWVYSPRLLVSSPDLWSQFMGSNICPSVLTSWLVWSGRLRPLCGSQRLEVALKSVLRSDLEDVTLALLMSPAQFDAHQLRKATKVNNSSNTRTDKLWASYVGKEPAGTSLLSDWWSWSSQ